MHKKTKQNYLRIIKALENPSLTGYAWTIKLLAQQLSLSENVVINALKKHNQSIKNFTHDQPKRKSILYDQINVLFKQSPPKEYIRWTQELLGKHFGVTRQRIEQIIKRNGKSTRKVLGTGRSYKTPRCEVKNCKNPQLLNNKYCTKHCNRLDRTGSLELRTFSYCNVCDREAVVQGYCFRHWCHIQKWGKIREDKTLPPRSKPSQADLLCSTPKCKRKCYAKNLCRLCYEKERRVNNKKGN